MDIKPQNTLEPNSECTHMGRYEIIKQLGEGAMGRVYLAQDPVLQRQVALKVIALDRQVSQATQTEFLQRFTFEAQASAKLSHQSIVTVYDAGQQDGIPWIAFEYIKGENLDQLLQRERQLSFDTIRTITLQIASALHHAHENHIIHRDIKPTNILIDSRTGIAKLADFGVVKAPWIGVTQSGVSVGSPGYMSPEQIDSSDIDARSDLFSLGVVLYELITGKHPFVRNSVPATFYATINQDYTPPEQLRANIPADLHEAVQNLLKSSKDERISSAVHLITLLQGASNLSNAQAGTPLLSKQAQIPYLSQMLRTVWSASAKKASTFIPVFSKHLISISKHFSIRTIYKFYKNKISQLLLLLINYLKKVYSKSISFFVSLKPATQKKIIVLLFTAAGLVLLLPLFFKSGKKEVQLIPDDPMPHYISKFDSFLNSGSLDSAFKYISNTSAQKNSVWSELFLARLELKRGNYVQAEKHFKTVTEKKRSIIKHQYENILADVEEIFRKGKAPDILINILVNTLSISDKKKIHEWLQHSHYWIRWNAVRIMEVEGKQVDMVSIYMLDLNTAASMRTRIRAAEKLGELGDRRAVPLLQQIGSRGIRDPFVSATARDVLRQYFKEDSLPQD